MKKLLSLTLILVMLLCALSACNIRSNDSDADTSTEIDTNSEIVTETDTSKDENSDKDTDISSDSSIDPVVNAKTWKFNYDYEGSSVRLLVGFSELSSGFENVVIPDSIVAGDTITIRYTGKWVTEESYPGRTSLYGELISYSFSYANVICLMGEQATTENLKAKYDFKHEYVILNREGEYVLFDEYEGNEIYLVLEQQNEETEGCDLPVKVACMLAYNPRKVDGGELPTITLEQAVELAEKHFYLNYAEDGIGFEYSTEIADFDDGWDVYFYKIYATGKTALICGYTVDKITGEIISLEIPE